MLGILLCLMIAGAVAAVVYVVRLTAGTAGNNTSSEHSITASELAGVLAKDSSAFQRKYYLHKITVTGKITSLRLLNTSSKCRQQVILDGEICCEFTEQQSRAHEGEHAEISGLCLGRILTGCKVQSR